jgi:hypothetical protein
MPSKADILKKFAKKHRVDLSLLEGIFEIERARLHPGEADRQYRQEEISKVLRRWVEDRPDVDKP